MRFKQQLLGALIALLICACGSRNPAPTAMPTSVPLTATPLEATVTTAVPPANVPPTVPITTGVTETMTAVASNQTPFPSSDALIDEILARMTVEEKLGQLFMVFFDGTEFSPALERTIQELHVGGILIFHGNVGPLEELAALITTAQSTAVTTGAQVPLFVAVDHEGGLISRFAGRITEFPGPMALAATGSVQNARAVAEVMSKELQALGINMNLAPVIDVNNNPDNPVIGARAFGSTPELVSTFGVTMIEGFQQNNLIATAKHFPGHGDTDIDSHSELPVIDKEMAQLQETELVPFAAAIGAGTDVIMTAHVAVPQLTGDPELPATFSRAILKDLLRDSMGFEGLIAADSLGMNALDLRYGITQTAALAVEAGVDLLMFGADPGHSPVEQYWAFEHLLERINAGELSTTRLNESVRRILQVKARYGLLNRDQVLVSAPSALELQGKIRTPEHLALVDQVSEEAVTLVKNDAHLLPLRPDQSIALIYPDSKTDLPLLFSEQTTNLTPIPITIDPDFEERSRIAAMAATSDIIVIATVHATLYPGQAALVEALGDRPVVVVALTSPYDLLAFPQQATYLTTYNDNLSLLSAAVKLLYGQIQPLGTLPVDLLPHFPIGFGLTEY
jgi:beta-N-acetylhexosaminidase